MKKIRSAVLLLVTVVLFAIIISLFAPGLANNINAAEDVIEVDSYDSLLKTLYDGYYKDKTIKLTSSIEAKQCINFAYPVTLDLDGHSINFEDDKYLSILLTNSSDVVTITGNGYIGGNFSYNGGLVYIQAGKLIIDSVTVENKSNNIGSMALNSKNGYIYIYTSTFIGCNTSWIKNYVKTDSFVRSIKVNNSNRIKTVFYNLAVADTIVSRDNAKDILGDGVFSYDFETKTLSINGNYSFDPDETVIKSKIPGLIIDIQGPSTLNGNIDLYYSTIITGNNKLTINSESIYTQCISGDEDLLIKDVSIDITSATGGIYCYNDSLTIDNAYIIVNSNKDAVFCEDHKLSLNDCKVIEPAKAVVGKDGIYEENGTDYATKVVIQPDKMWSEIEYTWSEDNSKCTAKRVCIVDESVIETETVNSTSTVKTPATTSEKGTTTYVATFLNNAFSTQTKDVQNIPVLVPAPDPDPVTDPSFEDFVERLYVVALDRPSEKEGKDYWCELVGNGTLTGADCARFFLTSPEFKGRGLSDEEFLKVLYKTFFDRNAADDPDGFNFWMNSLKSVGKDTVVEGFINSPEWCDICATYGVKSGAPTAKATKASKNATAFATRLYTECLGREPEEGGLKFWSLGLTNLELTGSQAAHEFFYSQEFNDHGFDNKELLTRMYRTFMGREPDTDGLNYWLNNMNNGMTKDQVFNSFVQSQEFTEICASYAIDRG